MQACLASNDELFTSVPPTQQLDTKGTKVTSLQSFVLQQVVLLPVLVADIHEYWQLWVYEICVFERVTAVSLYYKNIIRFSQVISFFYVFTWHWSAILSHVCDTGAVKVSLTMQFIAFNITKSNNNKKKI